MSSPTRVSDQAVVAALRSACSAGTAPPAAAWTLLVCLVARLQALSESDQSHGRDAELVALNLAHAGVFDCCANMVRSLAPVDSLSAPSNGHLLPHRWQACCALLLIPTVCDTLVTLAPRLVQTCYQSGVVALATALLGDMAPRQDVNLDLLLRACGTLVHLVLSGASSDADVLAACAVCCGPLLRRAQKPGVNAAALGLVCLYISQLLLFARRSGIANVTQRDTFSTAFALGLAVGTLLRDGPQHAVMESTPLSRALQASRLYVSAVSPAWQLVLADAAVVDGVVVSAVVMPHLSPHAFAGYACRCALVLLVVPWLIACQACGRASAWARRTGKAKWLSRGCQPCALVLGLQKRITASRLSSDL